MNHDFEKILQAAPSPFVLLDHELRVVWANDAYLQVTDRQAEKLFGKILTEEFPSDPDSESGRMLRGSFGRVFRDGIADHLPVIPYPISDADGKSEDRYWSATHTPILGAGGEVEFILQHTQDITDIYSAEALSDGNSNLAQTDVLRRAHLVTRQNLELDSGISLFKMIFEQAPNFMVTLMGPNHVFRTANAAYMKLVGQRDLIGKPLNEALPELRGQGFSEMLDEVYRSGKAVTQRGAEAWLQRSAEGPPERAFVDFVFQPLDNVRGETIGIMVQGHDVTAQKMAETHLREAEERFRTMAHTMPVHVWTATADGHLDWISEQLYAYSGAEKGSLVGDAWPSIIHPDDRAASIATWADAIRSETIYETEFRLRRADGAYCWHLVRAAPIMDAQGNLLRWVGTNSDIHEQKEMARELANLNSTLEERVEKRNRELEELHDRLAQSQRVEAVGNLAGGIAHDFNNLLQVMTGSLTMATRELPAEAPARGRIDAAMRAVERGASLSSQLLAFSRRQPLQPRSIDLRDLLTDIDDIIRSALGEGMTVEIDAADALWPAYVDAASTQNAVLNLLINARDAMEGRGKLKIAIANRHFGPKDLLGEPDMVAGDYVEVKVIDHGPGIPAETLPKVFDPFFTTKPVGKGTGLGLSTVYGFARQSGGRVTINSRPDIGTSVVLLLPRAESAAEPVQWHDPSDIAGGTETVLLVEDDAEVRDATAALLSDLGYQVRTAEDPSAALKTVRQEPKFDLLVSDVVMPGELSSRDMAETLQAERPDLPILFISGYSRDSIVRDGKVDAGVQFLAKPFTKDALAIKVRDALSSVPAAATARGEERPNNACHVLLCEDDALIRLDLADILQGLGTEVTETAFGQETLDKLETEQFDVLLIDVGLPDISGEEVATRVRKQHPDMPIIFATGQAEVPVAKTLGRCAVVQKPFGDRDLARAFASLGILPQTEVADAM
ncbi:Blue-light-activated protein [Sulfitobacter sp. DSM 110093]|uniref:hybrid sensor histidine kinase/response regulator n=1 Tax=Sulfitobacter sp. DSM 110093 TaxID=2883127 RepID=UPI001FAD783D|nr:response regulator [Sulfitobacter sp. DSM 110093]UOA32281.1 Blue-light-activated protein [Sulfitobacter sp. DSM 110093]